MTPRPVVSRRTALQSALGALALGAAAPLLARAGATPAQIEGPFFPTRAQSDTDTDLTQVEGRDARARGERVDVHGQVLDEDGRPVPGALVDVWQANAHGRYAHEADPNPAPLDPGFQGWARLTTDAEGRYRVRTIVPGSYPVRAGWARPPHIHFKVARRGYRELTTQMYFAGHALNDVDHLLLAVPESDRARLLVAFEAAADGADAVPLGRFDLVLARVPDPAA
jgi:protocatechuate 3,4-dioxygenase beta subunit